MASMFFAGEAVAQSTTSTTSGRPDSHRPASGIGAMTTANSSATAVPKADLKATPGVSTAPRTTTNNGSSQAAPSEAAKNMSARYLQFAQGRFTSKQFQQCIGGTDKAISYNPDDPKAYELRGSALYQLDKFDEALADLNRAEKLSKGSLTVQGYEDRAGCYAQLHEHQKVVNDYTKAIHLNPKLQWLYSQRAAAFSDIQQFDKAITDVNKAISIKPERYMYENRADYYTRAGQYQKAIDDYTMLMKIAPDVPMHYASRGKLLEKLGKPELARKDRAKAEEIIRRDMDP
jgi:tetratricopeptide (TPR) repeat protein